MIKKSVHPMPWIDFEMIYLAHLADADHPSCYIAYCRAEADVAAAQMPRRHVSYAAFRKAMSTARARRNLKQIAA